MFKNLLEEIKTIVTVKYGDKLHKDFLAALVEYDQYQTDDIPTAFSMAFHDIIWKWYEDLVDELKEEE